MREQSAIANIVHAMLGNVNRSRLLRPYVSIVQTAGQANMKLINPNPKDAILGHVRRVGLGFGVFKPTHKAFVGEAPASKNIVVE